MNHSINQGVDIIELVEAEFSRATYVQLKEALGEFLVTPFLQMRTWEYSSFFRRKKFPCWIIADFQKDDLGLAFSEFGHGSYGNRWGLVYLSDNYFGSDDRWFLYLEDAFINSGFYEGTLPADYEIR
jgi:hypothetical protein